jgi:hypothetical protein
MPRSLSFIARIVFVSFLSCWLPGTDAAETVNVDNFVRAETDLTFKRYVDQGAFGKFFHIRQPTPIDKQDVIRMNRDTLYSAGVFDLDASPLTVIKPNAHGRFLSMLVINQDHSMQPVIHEAGTFKYSRKKLVLAMSLFFSEHLLMQMTQTILRLQIPCSLKLFQDSRIKEVSRFQTGMKHHSKKCATR